MENDLFRFASHHVYGGKAREWLLSIRRYDGLQNVMPDAQSVMGKITFLH